MTVGPSARDGEIEAFIVDRYLESLLSRGPTTDADIPLDVREPVERLMSGLPRYHPSFRFEEALAARLATAASQRAGRLIEFPVELSRAVALGDERATAVRPVVIGGVTSAALAIAGAAYVAWRRGRPPAHAMTRAVRAVARARTS